ncbi:hypothetical protein ACFLYO_05890, partial [Chloroflexota bacterium]
NKYTGRGDLMPKRTKTKGLTIGRKLALSFGAMILLTILVGSLSMFTTTFMLQPAVSEAMHAVEEAFDASHMIENSLEARRREKDFLLNYEALGVETTKQEYLETFQENIQTILDIANQSWGYEGEDAASIEYELAMVAEIRDNATVYSQAFLNVVDHIEERGVADTGLVGELATTEALMQPAYDSHPEFQQQLLMLAWAKQTYLLDQTQESIELTHNLITGFKNTAQELDISAQERAEFLAIADEYLATFDALVALDQTIAAEIIAYKDAARAIVPLALELEESLLADRDEALLVYEQVTLTVQLLNMIFIIGAVVLGSGLAFWPQYRHPTGQDGPCRRRHRRRGSGTTSRSLAW